MENATIGRRCAAWLFCLLAGLWQASALGQEVTAERVEKSIERACRYLIGMQKGNGEWPGYGEFGTGQTALVTLALINAQQPGNREAIERGIERLRQSEPSKTYEVSLQVMAFCQHEPARDLVRIRKLVMWLLKQQVEGGGGTGGWGYPSPIHMADPSNSQFAALALWEAQRVGIPVPKETLRAVAAYWIERQNGIRGNVPRENPTWGGWGYDGGAVTGSMTAAGIASLLMAEEASMLADTEVRGDELICCTEKPPAINHPEAGMHALSRMFTVEQNPGAGGSWWFYYLYGLERVGRLTGQRLIGGHDWYREGCAELLKSQHPLKGFFNDPSTQEPVTATAMGVLFLSKGKRQIVIARARLPEDGQDDLPGNFGFEYHNHAINHLNGHLEQAWKRDLSWQSVQLEGSSLTDLLESPVLFFSGAERLDLNGRDRDLLRAYVEQGGTIFVEARNGGGCDAEPFERSFVDALAEVFEAPMRKLDVGHPVWNAQVPVNVENLPEDFWLFGIESCCRTAVIYSPISLACRWELARPYGIPAEVPPAVQAQLDEAVAVGLNVVTYATGRQLKDRLQVPRVELGEGEKVEVARGTLRLPRLRHAGGDDETARAVPHLLAALESSVPTQVDTTSPMILPTSEELRRLGMVYIHGRDAFEYSEADRAALRKYLSNGGFLLGDAVCASEAFADALEDELAAILPEAVWEDVPVGDPMLTDRFGGFDIRTVTLVDPLSGGTLATNRREAPPQLRRLIYQGRAVAVFSPLDLSCALESRGATQCRGYDRDDAAKIGINMILYALLQE